MAQAHWIALAELDLEEILYDIAVENGRPLTAARIGEQIRETCDKLAASPMLGESAPELGARLRLFSFKRWAIVYRPSDRGIDVIGIVDGSRAPYLRKIRLLRGNARAIAPNWAICHAFGKAIARGDRA